MIKEIKSCRACDSRRLEDVLDLGNHYVTGFPREPDPDIRVKAPLELVSCRDCELLQLKHTVPPDELFLEYWYRSGVTQTMRSELEEIVQQAMQEVELEPGDRVLDIGSNDGTLLSNYPDIVETVGFEPAHNIATARKCSRVHVDYFHRRPLGDKKFKIVTAIAMFYDVDDPNTFLSDVSHVLTDDGVFVCQQNYAPKMIEGNAFDNICHEHLCYYSLRSFVPLLEAHRLHVFAVSFNETNGGSFRVFAAKNRTEGCPQVDALRDWEERAMGPDAIGRFASRVEAIKRSVLVKLRSYRKPYVCGASTRGNTLLQFFGIDRGLVRGAGDRDPRKHGRYMPGAWIPIVSEDEMRREADCLLVLPWHFRDEITGRELGYVIDGGSLLFPLPEPELVTKDGILEM